jgi:hypothetical protein
VPIVMMMVQVWESRGHLSAHSDDSGPSMGMEGLSQCP